MKLEDGQGVQYEQQIELRSTLYSFTNWTERVLKPYWFVLAQNKKLIWHIYNRWLHFKTFLSILCICMYLVKFILFYFYFHSEVRRCELLYCDVKSYSRACGRVFFHRYLHRSLECRGWLTPKEMSVSALWNSHSWDILWMLIGQIDMERFKESLTWTH